MFLFVSICRGRMLPLHVKPSGSQRKGIHHSNQTLVRGDVENSDANCQKACGMSHQCAFHYYRPYLMIACSAITCLCFLVCCYILIILRRNRP